MSHRFGQDTSNIKPSPSASPRAVVSGQQQSKDQLSPRNYPTSSTQSQASQHSFSSQYTHPGAQQAQPQGEHTYQQQYLPYPPSSSGLGLYASSSASQPIVGQQSPSYQHQYQQFPQPRSSTEGYSYNAPQHSQYGSVSSGGYTGTWSSSEQPEMMATTHPLRTQFPTYPTPTSNSPASISSPQDHHRGASYRPAYGNSYYSHYSLPSTSQYLPNSASSYTSSQAQVSPQYQSSHILPSPSSYSQSGFIDQSPRDRTFQAPLQLSSQYMGPPQSAGPKPPGSAGGLNQSGRSHQGAAPGPIPATQPVVTQKGPDGQQVIQFEYSRDRVKVVYDISCNIESVETSKLPAEFKETNAVYPKARSKDNYKGNRWEYEARCNEIGWALAELNPSIRGKRGVIQRAVDSLRNCSNDPQQRSRRVRRLQKITKRQQNQKQNSVAGSSSMAGGLQSAAAFKQEPLPLPPTQHHMLNADEMSRGSVDSSDLEWSPHEAAPAEFPQAAYASTPEHSPIQERNFSRRTTMTNAGSDEGSRAQYAPYFSETSVSPKQNHQFNDADLFGNLQGMNMPTYLPVKDVEGIQVKIPKVFTQDVDGIVDDWRSKYAVFPQATQEDFGGDQSPLWRARSTERIILPNGKEYEVEIPQASASEHQQKQILNEIGYRMSWQRRQEFCDSKADPQLPRTMFLQRSMDKYRQHMSEQFRKNHRDPPSHFETRPGRPRWQSRKPQIVDVTA